MEAAFIRLTAEVHVSGSVGFIFRITACQDKLLFASVGLSFQVSSYQSVKRAKIK